MERPRPREITLGLQEDGEVVEARRGVRMLGARYFLLDRQRALMKRPRPRQVTLGLQEDGEVVEAPRRVRMIGAKRLFPDRQRALKERPRLSIGCNCEMPVLSGEIEQLGRPLFIPFRSGRFVSHESECVRIEPPGQAPGVRIAPDVIRIYA
jgi:hypothetical protein